jgi:hypothetical protein
MQELTDVTLSKETSQLTEKLKYKIFSANWLLPHSVHLPTFCELLFVRGLYVVFHASLVPSSQCFVFIDFLLCVKGN